MSNPPGGQRSRDVKFMWRAIELATRGMYSTPPNPRVGCVIVAGDRVVGEGWHQRAGGPHAEIEALHDAGIDANGATAYVTLEPCNHRGRTGPCSHALRAAGIRRVVYAASDDGEISGGGAENLRADGVEVEGGLLAEDAESLNPGFHRRQRGGRPWVRLKMAMSLDGRTALPSGESQWITAEPARADVHRWRARSCAVVTGIATVLADDPQLTARCPEARRQPLRVVFDSQHRTPVSARILEGEGETLILHGDPEEFPGGQYVPCVNGRVDIGAALDVLGGRGLNELWVEAGASLSGAWLQSGLWDELVLYVAPCMLGDGRPLAQLGGIDTLADRLELSFHEVQQIGPDLRIVARRSNG